MGAPSSSSSSSATIVKERRNALNRLDQALRQTPVSPVLQVRRMVPNVQPLFEDEDSDPEILQSTHSNMIDSPLIEANMSRLTMTKEQQARLYVEERLREIEIMRENRRFALYGELPPSRTTDNNKSKLSPGSPSSNRKTLINPRGEYNPPPPMQFSAQRSRGKKSYWPPLNNKPPAMMMNNSSSTISSKAKYDRFGHYVGETSSASLTIDNVTPMLSELPPLHEHKDDNNNTELFVEGEAAVNKTFSANATAAIIDVSTSTSLARVLQDGSSGDVVADLFASIVATKDDKVNYSQFVAQWRLLEQRFVNSSNIDVNMLNKNIRPAVSSSVVKAANLENNVTTIVTATTAPAEEQEDVLQTKVTTAVATKKTVVEPFIPLVQEDLITIPSQGRVLSTLNGSSGIEDWKCYSITDEYNATRVLLSFDILRGRSIPDWYQVGRTMKAGVIRPPKGAFDQMPKNLLYRGELLGNRVLGHVYLKKDPSSTEKDLQPIGTFQMQRLV